MYKNYFILNRIILELNTLLKESAITEVFSQEKDKLVLKCKGKEEKYTEISVNPGEPYITLRTEYHRAGKNSIGLFEEHLPQKIIRFEISDHDRIIRLRCETVNFYFLVRGKYSNVYLEGSRSALVPFKRTDEAYLTGFRDEIPLHNFISEIKKIDHIASNIEFEDCRKSYPFIGREIINEAKYRYTENNGKNKSDFILDAIRDIQNDNPAVFISSSLNEVFLAVSSYHFPDADEIKIFDSVIDALNFFIGRKFYLEAFISQRKVVEKFIERELSRLASKLNDLKARIERGSREPEYNKNGNLLLINLHQIPHKSSSIELNDIYENNSPITIKLDPKLTPQRNADYYFKKASNERIAFDKSKQLYEDISVKYKNLTAVKERFETIESLDEITNIMKELKIKTDSNANTPEDMKSKFKHYIIENKYDVYVGKDSTNNDLLTMKFAKQNDYWFHARSVPGSHVVLRVSKNSEPVPKNILKSAASIAAFHSKAKTSGLAPVSYTLKKYVTKKKGMEPGKVALLKEDVLLVKPEIPSNCEYISSE